MVKNNPQSADRAYKYTHKTLKIKFHRYFFPDCENIEFLETEIPGTGQRKDIVVEEDEKLIRIIEFMSKAVYDAKLLNMYDYASDTYRDPQYKDYEIEITVISTANPNHGKNRIDVTKNIIFQTETIFLKEIDGQKVLSNLIHKTLLQEELSDDEAIELLLLPDMEMNLPIKTLMKTICHLIGQAKIPDDDFRRKIIDCEKFFLARFFIDDELEEMIELLKTETKRAEYKNSDPEYGDLFAELYSDGVIDGRADGRADGILEVAENFLRSGSDEEYVSLNTGLPLSKIKNIKRRLKNPS